MHWWLKSRFTGAAWNVHVHKMSMIIWQKFVEPPATILGKSVWPRDAYEQSRSSGVHQMSSTTLGCSLGIGSWLEGNVRRILLLEPHRCIRNLLIELELKSRCFCDVQLDGSQACTMKWFSFCASARRRLWGTAPKHDNVSEWWILCWGELIWPQQLFLILHEVESRPPSAGVAGGVWLPSAASQLRASRMSPPWGQSVHLRAVLHQIRRNLMCNSCEPSKTVHWAINPPVSDHGLASVSACCNALLLRPKQADITSNLITCPWKIPNKYWACKGGLLQSVFITSFRPQIIPNWARVIFLILMALLTFIPRIAGANQSWYGQWPEPLLDQTCNY